MMKQQLSRAATLLPLCGISKYVRKIYFKFVSKLKNILTFQRENTTAVKR